MPSDPTPLFEPTNAMLAAAKPIYLVALGAVVSAWAVFGFVQKVERIEQTVNLLVILECRDKPHDTICEGVGR